MHAGKILDQIQKITEPYWSALVCTGPNAKFFQDGCSGVEEGGLGDWSPPCCDLMGAQPPNSVNFLELRAYMNHYSDMNGYFRFKRL